MQVVFQELTMLGGTTETRDLYADGPYGAFEQAVERQLGDAIRADEKVGVLLWSALANVRWEHPEHGEVGYSWRAAGDLVAAVRREGNYMDWYMSGTEAQVFPEVGDALAREGWQHKFYE
jgi:hypothetical protein